MDEFFNGNEILEIQDRIINWSYSDYCNWCLVRKKTPMNYINFLELEGEEKEKRRSESARYMR